jgi:hypothetical protein
MRRLLTIVLCAGLFSLGSAQGGGSAGFFNGKDLTGWQGNPELWSVKDGAIVGSTFPDGLKGNTFLSSKDNYKDFELKFQVRLLDGNGNSGVQIRSKLVDEKKFVVRGPQVDMARSYWGSLYGEGYSQDKGFGGGGMMKGADPNIVKEVVKDNGDFVEYYVRCVGNHVTIKINGATTVDDDFKLPEEGVIAWQLHAGKAMEVTFRNIQFKDLSSAKQN